MKTARKEVSRKAMKKMNRFGRRRLIIHIGIDSWRKSTQDVGRQHDIVLVAKNLGEL